MYWICNNSFSFTFISRFSLSFTKYQAFLLGSASARTHIHTIPSALDLCKGSFFFVFLLCLCLEVRVRLFALALTSQCYSRKIAYLKKEIDLLYFTVMLHATIKMKWMQTKRSLRAVAMWIGRLSFFLSSLVRSFFFDIAFGLFFRQYLFLHYLLISFLI